MTEMTPKECAEIEESVREIERELALDNACDRVVEAARAVDAELNDLEQGAFGCIARLCEAVRELERLEGK